MSLIDQIPFHFHIKYYNQKIFCTYNTDEIKDNYWLADKHYPFEDMCMTLNKVIRPNDGEVDVRWSSASCNQTRMFICQVGK